MNEETESNLNEAIDWLQTTASSMQDFAVEQAPLYCQELVAWHLWEGITMVVLALVGLAIASIALKKAIPKAQVDEWAMTPPITIVASCLVAIFAVISLITGVHRSVKAAVSPRLVIVEHLRALK